jgi:hypothetical protein
VKAGVLPPSNELDWARLLDTEAELGARIAAEERAAQARVAVARAAASAAVPDPTALAARSAANEQTAIERHRSELARVAAESEATVRTLQGAPDSLIDALAQFALDAALTDALPAQRR